MLESKLAGSRKEATFAEPTRPAGLKSLGENALDHSLSIVLPVHNAETTLARQVLELLEVLPELTSRFEVLIVDDGSTDHTEEIAYDLAREFPQLHVARHPRRRGAGAAVETGLEQTSGDILFVPDGQTRWSPGQLRRLWAMRKENQPSASNTQRAKAAADPGLIERLVAWGSAVEELTSPAAGPKEGIRVIRRRTPTTDVNGA
jgi:glycosyltransferase involved in cell wall biosynthesis